MRVAVLGAGFMGQSHAKAVTKAGAELVAVCSKPLDTATKLSQDITGGKAQCFDDFDAMLAGVDFDVLYVCLPPTAHKGEIAKAAKAKKHLFVEKPLGLDVTKAMAMAVAAKKARVVTQMGYHMRYGSAVQQLKAMIESGEAGKPTLFHGSFQCNALHKLWWQDVKQSGGQLVEQAIHVYDLAMYFLGKPTAVSALAGNLCHKKIKTYTVEDTSASLIRFAGGAMASITASNCAIPMQWRSAFTVVCEKLTAEFADPNTAIFTIHGGKPSEEWWTSGKKPEVKEIKGDVDMYLAEDTAFLAALAGGKKSTANLQHGADSLQLVTAAMKSAKAGGKQIKL